MQTCKTCKEKTLTIFTEKLVSLPDVCIFQLQKVDIFQKKIENVVIFPLENLDLSEFMISKNQEILYNLTACCNHSGGTARSGHYYTYAKNFLDKKWYCFDDSSFRIIDEKNIMSPQSYILFYEYFKPYN